MNKSNLLRVKEIIETSKNIECCMKSLNLDIYSSFMCFYCLLGEGIFSYDQDENYEFLIKTVFYLQILYQKLSPNKKKLYRPKLQKIRKLYKDSLSFVDSYNKEYYKNVFLYLDNLLNNKKKEIEDIQNEDNLYELLYEVIFSLKSLEYLDVLIEKIPNIINSKQDEIPIFLKVLEAYLNDVKTEKLENKNSYYSRVLNKFLHEETFDLTNKMRDIILNNLNDFLNGYKNISKEDLEMIKNIIAHIKKQCALDNYNIDKSEYILSKRDLHSLEKFNKMIDKRVFLKEYIITIDDSNSQVLDDGISIFKLENGNILFKVHIADPLAIFPYKSDVIQDAKNRTTTIYTSDEPIQMLPNILGSNKLSLMEDRKRLAKSFCFEYNQESGIVNFYIENTLIIVSKRYTYEDINELYKKGGTNKNEEEMFLLYDEIITYLKKVFQNAKLYEEIKQENIIGHYQKMNSFSENLVSYSMMFTGYMTAKYFSDNKLPFAYRCHQYDPKWQQLLDQYKDNLDSKESKKLLTEIKSMFPKSYYSGENVGHMGLKIPCYSHITSPLRRFADILDMHALNICYFQIPRDKELYKLEQEIDLTCSYLNMQSNSIDEYLTKMKVKK